MNFRALVAVATAVGALIVWTAPASEAAPRRKSSAPSNPPETIANPPSTVFVTRDESGRTRTRIIVQKRSYLDGGTEILPGQRHFLDYAIPPYYSPLDNALGPGKNFDRQPLNPQWESGWPRMWRSLVAP
jgi:hypothetical protein